VASHTLKLAWHTQDGDGLIAYMARVSNPDNQDNKGTEEKLLKYLIKNKHWSPFEMVHACVEIETTRDIGRELLRHRSFSFQEFSQRYADPTQHMDMVHREARVQHPTNRQASLPCEEDEVRTWWEDMQSAIEYYSYNAYTEALKKGVAKEVARAILPEGMTPTKLYMVGSIRSWIHFWDVRIHEAAQKEMRELAIDTRNVILDKYPTVGRALDVKNTE